MDSPGDPHLHTPAPTDPLQEQTRGAWEVRKKAMKRARWRQKREKLRQEAVALKLEQGPSELQKEDPQVCQISPPGTLAMGSHGHPGTPVPTNPHEKQDRRAMKKANKPKKLGVPLKIDQGPSKHHQEDLGKSKITPGSLSPAFDTQHIEEQARRNRRQREPPEFRPEYPLYSRAFIQAHYRHKEEMRRKEEMILEERRRQAGRLYSSSTRVTSSPAPKGARVRQSVLYSGRPMRSKRSTTDKILVEEHVTGVSSREFEALTLDQSPPTPDSTHRPTGTTIHVRQSALYSSRLRKSRGRQEQEPSENKPVVEENPGKVSASEGPTFIGLPESKVLALNDAPRKPELTDRSKECDAAGSETESEVLAEEEPKDDSEFDSEEEWRKHREYKEKMFNKDFAPHSTTQAASCDKNSSVEHVTEYSGAAEWAKRAYLTWQKSLLVCSEAQHTMVASSSDEPTSEVSDEDIVENANKWMSEEMMVAFNEYIGRNDKLRELKYRFEKLCHQCFNVECYFKIFHHYNFTVEVKLPSSDDWESRTYFAEVKEIFGKPYYFCCPLESDENGIKYYLNEISKNNCNCVMQSSEFNAFSGKCYACCNQGVNDLMHPATGGFERGLPDNVFPYM